VIANAGVGDVDSLIVTNRVGAVAAKLDADSYRDALDQVSKLDGSASERSLLLTANSISSMLEASAIEGYTGD
jgi:hypothetical protein